MVVAEQDAAVVSQHRWCWTHADMRGGRAQAALFARMLCRSCTQCTASKQGGGLCGLAQRLMWAGSEAHVGWLRGSCELAQRLMWAGSEAHVSWLRGSCGLAQRLM